MILEVPHLYASYLRNRKILSMSAMVIPAILLAFLFRNDRVHYAMIGFSAISGSSLFFLLVSYRQPLDYDISGDGISLRIQNSKSRLTGLHDTTPKNWLNWRADPLVAIEITHWRQSPALLFRTTKHREGKIVPFEKEDLNRVQDFLEDACLNREARLADGRQGGDELPF